MEFIKIFNFIGQHFAEYLYIILFVLGFVEEAGVPLPFPGDIYMFLAGYQVYRNHANIFLVIMDIVVASMLGSSVLFFLISKKGEPLIKKYGKYIFLNHEHIMQGKGWFEKHGELAVLIGRWIPGLKVIMSVVAGIFNLEYYRFLIAVGLSMLVWSSLFVVLGIKFGKHYQSFLHWFYSLDDRFSGVSYVVIAIIVLVLLYSFYISLKKARESEKNA